MGIISLGVMGFLVGLIARALMPGKDAMGFFRTVLLGIVGAFLGGFIGSLLGFGSFTGFNLRSLILAVIGAMILLLIFKKKK